MLSFRNKIVVNTFPDKKKKLRDFITTTSFLQEVVKGVLHVWIKESY